MNFKAPFAAILTVSLALSACADGSGGSGVSNTVGGAAIGGVAGAALGATLGGRNRGAAALVGGLAGAALGGVIGAQLDSQSQARRQTALNALAERAERERDISKIQPVAWSNTEQSTSGQVRVRSRLTVAQGRRCIGTTETVTINGRPEQVDATRCRGADGNWA